MSDIAPEPVNARAILADTIAYLQKQNETLKAGHEDPTTPRDEEVCLLRGDFDVLLDVLTSTQKSMG